MHLDAENPFDNPAFRKELTQLLDQKLRPITDKVDSHDAAINQSKGLIAGMGLLWALVVMGINYLIARAMR